MLTIKKNFKKWLPRMRITLFIVVVTVLFIVHSKGISLADEGYIVQAGWRIAQGELPFKDFFIAYTPLSTFITAGAFLFFGESIIVSRLTALVFSIGTCILLYKMFLKITKSDLISILNVTIFIVWGPMHINFAWPVVFTNFFAVATCYILLTNFKSKGVFQAGVLSSLTFLSKQNFGLAIVAAAFIAYIINQKTRNMRSLVLFISGFSLPALFFILYILVNNLWPYFIENYYFYFYKKLILDGNGATPFIVFENPLKDIVKILFYLLPVIISLLAAYVCLKKKRKYLFLPIFVIFYYLAGIRPVTDLVHLSSLLAVSSISFAIVIKNITNKLLRNAVILIGLTLIALGLYSSLLRGYYRWESPIFEHNILPEEDRLNVYIDEKHKILINDTKKYIEKNTNANDYVFVNHYIPSLNFIINRPNPTRFIYLHPNVLDYKYQREVESNLKNKNVLLIITEEALINDKSHLAIYIKRAYRQDKVMHGYIFWQRR